MNQRDGLTGKRHFVSTGASLVLSIATFVVPGISAF